jgi:hypothetical protein
MGATFGWCSFAAMRVEQHVHERLVVREVRVHHLIA